MLPWKRFLPLFVLALGMPMASMVLVGGGGIGPLTPEYPANPGLVPQMRIDGPARNITTAGNITTTGTGQFLAADGSAAAPSYSFTSLPNTGIFDLSGNVGISVAGVARLGYFAGGSQFKSDSGVLWSGSTVNAASDTGITRISAGTVGVGNGTQGDATGTIGAATFNATTGFRDTNTGITLNMAGAAGAIFRNNGNTTGSLLKIDALPTISAGFGTSPSLTAGSTPLAGSVVIGTGASSSGTINFNGTAFPSVPFCVCQDSTSVFSIRCSATTTQLSILASAAWTPADIVNWICISSK